MKKKKKNKLLKNFAVKNVDAKKMAKSKIIFSNNFGTMKKLEMNDLEEEIAYGTVPQGGFTPGGGGPFWLGYSIT
jgi:hypothetical protein